MSLDIAIIIIYLVGINLVGYLTSRNNNVQDYFLGGRSLHWTIVCFSIVATETSTLTFISIPGLSYISGMGFLQVAFGYLAGRVIVAIFLLPKYFEGKFETVYQFIDERFGVSSKRVVSVVFHVTRVLADSVRLFATAIPITVMIGWDYRLSILVIGIATFIYTYYGGLRSVIVVDAVQLFLYITCAVTGMYLITDMMGMSAFSVFHAIPAEKIQCLFTGFDKGWGELFGSYNLVTGIIGGGFLSLASHGTDHLIVQRVLSCKDVHAARKAMVMSGVCIIFQFALFLLFGLFIRELFNGAGFERGDDIIPHFIVNYLPAGYRGLMLAGIFATAMSTLSSTINSLSSSTFIDILDINRRAISDKKKISISRMITIFWTIIIVLISIFLENTTSSLVVIGLSIASVTYGGMLGIFIMGRFVQDFSESAAISGMLLSIILNIWIAFFTQIFWLWYVTIGFFTALIFGIVIDRLIYLFKKNPHGAGD
ncbi:MAG TPA: sodium/solute symporter [Spirochaetota bacterium]|nr:sodium/solute symporter [Spirochaetota bacterium]